MSTLSTIAPTDPKELRPLLHRKLDEATDEELKSIHNLLLELEARRVLEELDEATEQAWASGQINEKKIAAAILEHRQAHPYR